MIVPLIENRLAHLKRIYIEHHYSREKTAPARQFFSQLKDDIKRANYSLGFLHSFGVFCPFSIITPMLYIGSNRLEIAKEYICRVLSKRRY